MSLYLHGFEKQRNEYLEEKKPIRNCAKTYFPVSFQKNVILMSILTKGGYCTRLMAVLTNVIPFRAKS